MIYYALILDPANLSITLKVMKKQ